jgi:hypothetical protein
MNQVVSNPRQRQQQQKTAASAMMITHTGLRFFCEASEPGVMMSSFEGVKVDILQILSSGWIVRPGSLSPPHHNEHNEQDDDEDH